MPTKVPKAGVRRSGQGQAAPALFKPIVKNFDPPRDPWLAGAGGSAAAASDTEASRRTQTHYPDEDTYQGGDDVLWPRETDEEGEYGCRVGAVSSKCYAPRGEMMMKESQMKNLVSLIREMIEDPVVLVDEDDDELEGEEADEISAVAGISGYTSPLGASPYIPGGKKRKPSWQAAGSAFGRARPVLQPAFGRKRKRTAK